MKNFFLRTILLVLGLIMGMSTWSATYTFQSGGIGYEVLSTTGLTVAVVNSARASMISGAKNVNYKGNVVIPETVKYGLNGVGEVKTYTVTTIAAEAFKYGSAMTSLTIPATVTSIGSNAFDGATGLESLTLADKEDDGTQLAMASTQNCPLKTAYIGRQVKNFNHVEHATFGPSIKTLGPNTFQGCSSPISVTIPETMTAIGDYAFWGCSGLESITIPSSITTISYRSFGGCTSLKQIKFPNSLEMIYYDAFLNCSSLSKITIPNKVHTVAPRSFSGCTSLKDFIIEDGDKELIMGATDNSNSPFIGCPIDSVYLGRNLKKAFDGFWGTELSKIEVGDKVTCLLDYMFSGCTKLTNVHLGGNLNEINDGLFANATSLVSIIIPEGVKRIGYRSFIGCTS